MGSSSVPRSSSEFLGVPRSSSGFVAVRRGSSRFVGFVGFVGVPRFLGSSVPSGSSGFLGSSVPRFLGVPRSSSGFVGFVGVPRQFLGVGQFPGPVGSSKVSEVRYHRVVPFIERRRRDLAVAQGASPGSPAFAQASPEGATELRRRRTTGRAIHAATRRP
jgi:hypothetical protein